MNYRIILSSVLLFNIYFSFGQQNNLCQIKCIGKVIDGKSKEALIGATVFVKELNMGLATDDNGNFVFNNLCPGKYIFICEYVGYGKIQDTIKINKSVSLSFALKTSANEINEVVVKGERKNEEGLNTLTQIKIEGMELDKTMGQSLGESLKDIAGLNSIQTGRQFPSL